MTDDTSSIWMKMKRRGRRTLNLGAIYREHTLLKHDAPTNDIPLQISRWRKQVLQWKAACRQGESVIIGDLNLDHQTWEDPTPDHRIMVDIVKNEIETTGFSQMIKGITRCWPHQRDSLVDHLWTDIPENIISTRNFVRSRSDHNVIAGNIRIKGIERGIQEIIKRKTVNFNLERYRDKLKSIHWEEILEMKDLERANLWFENKLNEVINSESPLVTVQNKKKIKNWITEETAKGFKIRDESREKARKSKQQVDWDVYKRNRNESTAAMRKDKKKYFSSLYNQLESRNDTKGMYRQVREQLGWREGGPPKALIVNGEKITAPRTLAQEMQKYYKQKIVNLMSTLPASRNSPLTVLQRTIDRWGQKARERPKMTLRKITISETLSYIKELGSSTSFGHDFIDAQSIKLGANYSGNPYKPSH